MPIEKNNSKEQYDNRSRKKIHQRFVWRAFKRKIVNLQDFLMKAKKPVVGRNFG